MTARPWPSLGAMVESAGTRYAGLPAVIDEDGTWSYAEIYEQARMFGAALVADGVGVGDRVSIWAFNCREWIVAALGLVQTGAILIPINTRFKGMEATDLLARGRVSVLVTVTDFLGTDYVEMLRQTGVDLPHLRTVVVARGPVREATVGWDDFVARPSPSDVAELDRRRKALGPDDPVDMLFTSGTTGVPKGVLMTHAQTMAVATDWTDMTGLDEGDRYLMINPYFHMFGLKAGILTSVSIGAAMIPVPVFDIDHVLDLVQRHRVTVFPGPPTVLQMILDHPGRERYDLSSLRSTVTGAADIPVDLIERIRAELPFRRVVSGYGMTESGTSASTSPHDSPETIATTVGRARPGFEIRVVTEHGQDALIGEVGEITVRGPSVMTEYVDDPDATAAVLSPDGWLRTGDLGSLDESGCLKIVGRTKDMFIVGGFNAYPAEIESIMMRNPALRHAAVVGVPDHRLGQVGLAFVVAEHGATEASVLTWCRANMANYKVPRHVRFLEDLPLNASGKVHKKVLREWAAEAADLAPGATARRPGDRSP